VGVVTDFLTIRAAAACLGVAPHAVLRLIHDRRLNYVHPTSDSAYLVPADEVCDLLSDPLVWAYRWAYCHPEPARVDRLEGWGR
jgi:hypothetical protein